MKAILSALFLSTATLALAADAGDDEDENKSWSGSAELGLIFTTGNTQATSVNAQVDIVQTLDSWVNEFQFDTLFKEDRITDDETSEEDTQKTAEKLFASAKGNYNLETDHSKLFIYASYTDDKFGPIRKNKTVATGWGSRIFETNNTHLDADIGPGYTVAEKSDGEEIEEPIIRASASYIWVISENAAFKQEISTEASEENTNTIARSSLSTKINSSLQMKLGLSISHNAEVPEDTRNTDTESTVTLVYSF